MVVCVPKSRIGKDPRSSAVVCIEFGTKVQRHDGRQSALCHTRFEPDKTKRHGDVGGQKFHRVALIDSVPREEGGGRKQTTSGRNLPARSRQTVAVRR